MRLFLSKSLRNQPIQFLVKKPSPVSRVALYDIRFRFQSTTAPTNGEHATTAPPPPEETTAKTSSTHTEGTAESTDIEKLANSLSSEYIVKQFSDECMKRDGREGQVEAVVWHDDTTYHPILCQKGQKNVYYYTDDIPKHVEPFFHFQPQQHREYFRIARRQWPLWQRILFWIFGAGAFAAFGYCMLLVEVWYHQPREILMLREEILQHAFGRVLELGAGQGANVGLYPYPAHDVFMMDQDEIMLRRLKQRLPKTVFPTYHIMQHKVENLEEIPTASFDTVVDTFGLCHYRDPVTVLRQMQRICKPTGVILLLEHGRTPYEPVNWFLDYYADQHSLNTHGCRWNKPLEDYVKESRLIVKDMRRKHYGTTFYCVAYPEAV